MDAIPTFSIIVATKDRPKDLIDFLQTLRETRILGRKDVEVIIIDNNSKTDDVRSICGRFDVKYVVEKTQGKAIALNRGLKESRGEFLVFTDDDTLVKNPEWLDKLYAHFMENKKLGYVSGNVLAHKIETQAQGTWERKGGLSKGSEPKHFCQNFLNTYRFKPWPLTKICAGANCMIPRKVFQEIGGYCTLFGPGALIGHGESLEIGYRIMRAGYELYYEPNAIVYHKHPQEELAIKRKLFLYGTGDTGIHTYIFLKYQDWRSLFWAFGGHQLYVLKNMFKRLTGGCGLPVGYLAYSLAGSALGGLLFVWRYLKFPKRKD